MDLKNLFRNNLFQGKVMVLTGGTSRMLYQVALDFMILGGSVALLSRREVKLDKISRKLMESVKNKTKAKGYKGDVRKYEELFKVIDNIIKDFGKIDYLVNGASGNFLADAETLSPNGFKTILEIDTLGCFIMCKLVYNKWMKHHGGVIINISSTVHHLGTFFQIHSGSAKAAIDNITKVLALEWGSHKVRVNGIAPALIKNTEGFERFMDLSFLDKKDKSFSEIKDVSFKDKISELVPLQSLGTRDNISHTVIFLISDAASYITGQTLVVDGGHLATVPNYMVLSNKVTKFLKPKF
jgi:peroxisomal 2,4-dienoyl-CoA reductase